MQAAECTRENWVLGYDPRRTHAFNQGGFDKAKQQLSERGLIPDAILNDPKKLRNWTNLSAVQNLETGKIKELSSYSKAISLVNAGAWRHVEGAHQGGVMTIYHAATIGAFEDHIGLTGMQLTGYQNLVQTIYHEYMHYSGVRDHGSTRGSFEYNSWGRKEGRALGGWINGL